MTFHHIGIVCFDIDETSRFYISHGYKRTEPVYDPIQNVIICFCTSETGMHCIELIAPKDASSPICKILQKNGVSPYHLCYETTELEQAISDLKKQKFLIVSKPAPAVAFGGKRVCFLFNKYVGLIELKE